MWKTILTILLALLFIAVVVAAVVVWSKVGPQAEEEAIGKMDMNMEQQQ